MDESILLFSKHIGDVESGNDQTEEHTTFKLTEESEKTPIENVGYRSKMLIHNKSVREYFREKVWASIKVAGVEKFYHIFNTDLLLAIQEDDLSRTIKALDRGASVDAACKYTSLSACHLAAYYGSHKILEELIKRKANFTKQDNGERSPLEIAVWTNNIECVDILSKEKYLEDTDNTEMPFKHKASFYCMDTKTEISKIWSGYSALHLASACLHVKCVEILLAADYSLTSKDKNGLTALDVCGKKYYNDYENISIRAYRKDIEERFYKILQMYVNHKKCQKIKDGIQNSMKMIEHISNNNECDKIKDDIQTSIKNPEVSASPLHFAVLLDSRRSINLLHTEMKAFIGCQNKDGDTPLHTAATYKMEKSLIAVTNIFTDTPVKSKGLLDKTNNKKQTPLHLAIASGWITGVNMLLVNGSNFMLRGEKNKSVLHMTAETGNVEMLLDIIEKKPICKQFINDFTDDNETPLYIAIARSDIHFLKKLLDVGNMCNINLNGNGPNDTSVIHKSAEVGDKHILLALLNSKHGDEYWAIASNAKVSPLYLATENNNAECVKILLDGKINKKQKVLTLPKDVSLSEKNDTDDNLKCLPYHKAAHMGHKECIRLFIEHGADISEEIPSNENELKKVLDVITSIMHNPVEYLEDLCSSFININEHHLDDSRCRITIDYSFLMPPMVEKSKDKETCAMRIAIALTNPDSNYDQKKLILHPLIESFQYLHWKELNKFFLYILVTYCLFVVSLTATVVIIYNYDIYSNHPSIILYKSSCIVILWITMVAVFLQDLLFLSVKKLNYLKSPAAIIKMGSLALSLVVSLINHNVEEMWPRYVTAGAILMAWIEIVMLLSRFPKFGYLYQMFATVAFRVLKVMALFGCFMILGFSLAFWVLFKSEEPFNGPWNSVMKTIVMMTSEFDYSSLAGEKGWMEDPSFPQLIFVIFLVAMPIVVMNLLVALAVSDTKDLMTEGKIQRLLEQLQFLSTLDLIVCTPLWNLLPKCLNNHKKSCLFEKNGVLTIEPVNMKKHFSKDIITAIYQIVIKKIKCKDFSTPLTRETHHSNA